MPRYVLTGTPGAGKTSILRALERAGQRVVEEAATDVIALEQALGRPEPEQDPQFLDKIVSFSQQDVRLGLMKNSAAKHIDARGSQLLNPS